MRHRTLACIVSLLMLTSPLMVPVVAGPADDDGRVSTTPDGPIWMNGTWVDRDGEEDALPHLHVTEDGSNHVAWSRNGRYVHTELSAGGEMVTGVGEVAERPVGTAMDGSPRRAMDLDEEGDLHIVYFNSSSGGGRILYEEWGSDGIRLEGPVTVSDGEDLLPGTTVRIDDDGHAFILYNHVGTRGGNSTSLSVMGPEGDVITRGEVVGNASLNVVGSTFEIDNADSLRVILATSDGNQTDLRAVTVNRTGVSRDGTTHTLFSLDPEGAPPVLPEIAVCPDNNLALLIYMEQGASGEARYMTVDAMNRAGNSIVGSDLVTLRAAGRGDLACDDEGYVHLVYVEDPGNGTHRLEYRLLADGDFESGTEAGTLDAGHGNVSDPRVETDPWRGVHVLWMDDGDGDGERDPFYRYGGYAAVELSMAPQEQAKLMFMHPEEIKCANLTVRNRGPLNVSVHLNLTTDLHGLEGKGWGVAPDEVDLDLEGGEETGISVCVFGPSDGNPGDFMDIVIEVRSSDSGQLLDQNTVRSTLVAERKVEVAIVDNVHATFAGTTTGFEVMVTNAGDLAEDIGLEAEGPEGWGIWFNRTGMQLGPGEGAEVMLNVTPSMNATPHQEGGVTVRALLEGTEPLVNDTAIAHVIIWERSRWEVNVSVSPATATVRPAEKVSFEIGLRTPANNTGNVHLMLDVETDPADWEVLLERESLSLYPGEEEGITMMVRAPGDARRDDVMNATVRVLDEERGNVWDAGFSAVVQHASGVEIATPDDPTVLEEGENGTVDLAIRNLGNDGDRFELQVVDQPLGWVAEYRLDGEVVRELALGPWAEGEVELRIEVPGKETGGPYSLELRARGINGDLHDVVLDVEVAEEHELDIAVPTDQKKGQPGSQVSFSFELVNHCNCLEEAAVATEGLDAGWQARIVEAGTGDEMRGKMVLEPGARSDLTLYVSIPEDHMEGDGDFELVARGEGVEDRTRLEVMVRSPDVVATYLEVPEDPVGVDEAVSLVVGVNNTGEIEARGVVVEVYVDGELLNRRTLEILPAGNSEEVKFNWIPVTDGKHAIRAMLDPDDVISERDESNNVLEENVEVEGGTSASTSTLMDLIPPIILVVIVVALAALAMLSGGRGPSRPGEGESILEDMEEEE